MIAILNENLCKIRFNLIASAIEKHYHYRYQKYLCGLIMVVCLCRNVKTSQIVEAVKGGARSVDQVREVTGAASCCGKCQFMVNALVTDHSDDSQCDYYDAATA